MYDSSPMPSETSYRGTVSVIDPDSSVRTQVEGAAQQLRFAFRGFANFASFSSAGLAAAPSCVVVSLGTPDAAASEALRLAKQSGGAFRVVCLAGSARVADVVSAMEQGALTVLETPLDVAQLEVAIQHAIEASQQDDVTRQKFRELAAHVAQLSEREHRVLQHIAAGALNKVIAGTLEVSVRTVESDRARVVEKLGAQTTGEAVAKYAQYQVLNDLGYQIDGGNGQ